MGTVPKPPSWVPGLTGLWADAEPLHPNLGAIGLDINRSGIVEDHPLFTHPHDWSRKGRKDPTPHWLCSLSCLLSGAFGRAGLHLLTSPHGSTHCKLPSTPDSAEPAPRGLDDVHTPSPSSHQPLFWAPGSPSHPLLLVLLNGDTPKVSSRPFLDISLSSHIRTRTPEFLVPS